MRITLHSRGDLSQDLDLAHQIGKDLREPGNQLDFSGVDEIGVDFLRTLLAAVLETRDQAALMSMIALETMTPQVQMQFLQALQTVHQTTPTGDTQSTQDIIPPEEMPPQRMNPFDVLRQVQADYLLYVRTFQRFNNPTIRQWVLDHIENGSLLWKPPYIQIARPYTQGESLEGLVEEGLLHPGVLNIFRKTVGDPTSALIHPYLHQSQAIRAIQEGNNVIVATGTGSGKSFAFGMPIISEALRQRAQGVQGIKAVIVYPMNALANSQYDEFAARLHGSGLTIGRYTGDTATDSSKALSRYQQSTGRVQPYDCEILSRKEMQENPPDILMTNYVMLELLLTRFEDRYLFSHPGVLQFLVLDEVHTYSGKRGADVAALIRRLKQHTHTAGQIRCIGTSATVESGEQETAAMAISNFASLLFGETFSPENVIGETYDPVPENLDSTQRRMFDHLTQNIMSSAEVSTELGLTLDEVEETLLTLPGLPPKLHAFFSQGRTITACLDAEDPHLNDRGEPICPICADEDRDRPTFPMVFCRACGQEYYSVAIDEDGQILSSELDAVSEGGRVGYLFLQTWDEEDNPLPENWKTPTGKIRKAYKEVLPERHTVCPECATLDSPCTHEGLPVIFIPAPFLFCPNCCIVHDRRSREFNKLFTFGTVGRSTATDVLINAQVRSLPRHQRKVIAFSDNRQDTALQAAHMNSLHNRFAFRRALYQTLLNNHEDQHDMGGIGLAIYEHLEHQNMLPHYQKGNRLYGGDHQADERYQQYLIFLTLQELRGTHRRTHQNLEDVGLLDVTYSGLTAFSEDDPAWTDIPELANLSAELRYDLLLGFLDLIRKRLAIKHNFISSFRNFKINVLNHLNEDVLFHDEEFRGAIGYSDVAETNDRNYTAYRFTGNNTQITAWVRRVLNISTADANELINKLVVKLAKPEIGFLETVNVKHFGAQYSLYVIPNDILLLEANSAEERRICPRCLTVHRFRTVDFCTGSTCRTTLEERNLNANYFRQMYTLPFQTAGRIKAEEHSGQVRGEERRKIEIDFRDPDNPLNVLICTPTMELGIDIGHLNAVTLRNVPPSPSNYAQRAGRAGRSGQASLITVFAGVGSARGPHDQYFYRFPEKMIAGAIAAPRFRLNNEFLLKTHINALVLETMGQAGAEKLPARPDELLDLNLPQFPIKTDLAAAWERALRTQHDTICEAVYEAFAHEMTDFDWFTQELVEDTVQTFLNKLDQAMDRWRIEYERLDDEREHLNITLGTQSVDAGLSRRRYVIEKKLEEMREGKRDWYVYRYLGGEGFLPGYAFPPQATHLSFDFSEDEIARSPAIALTEYAPGNFVYYRGERYEISYGRPRTRELQPDTEPILICPDCEKSYVGTQDTHRAACDCGKNLQAVHPKLGMPLCDMFALRRARITADEEERLRLGYELSSHYMQEGRARHFQVSFEERNLFKMTLANDGQILLINHGPRTPDGSSTGFTLCTKCFAWLLTDNKIQSHVSTTQKDGDCSQNAKPEDLIHNLRLTHLQRSDLAIFDIPLPEGMNPFSFYTTMKNALLRSIMVGFQLDESEIDGFLLPNPEDDQLSRIILYETTMGGSGVLSSLNEPGRLETTFAKMWELLHGDDPDGGCEVACYECLLSFYNQREHRVMDRNLVMAWLEGVHDLNLDVALETNTAQVETLRAECQSSLEEAVLDAIIEQGLPLPNEAQHTIFDAEGVPIATADFFYEPRLVVFVDGSPHHRDYVQDADDKKRRALRKLGYQIAVVRGDAMEAGLEELRERLS